MRTCFVLLLLTISLGLLPGCTGPSPQDTALFFMDGLLRGNPAAVQVVCDEKQEQAAQALMSISEQEQSAGATWYNTKNLHVELVEKRDDTALVRLYGMIEKHWKHGRVDKQPINAFYSLARTPAGWKICF